MRNKVVQHFETIFELVEEFMLIFNDKLSDQQTIVQKLTYVLEKKQNEIDDKSLISVRGWLEMIFKELERQIERTRATNLAGTGKIISIGDPSIKYQH